MESIPLGIVGTHNCFSASLVREQSYRTELHQRLWVLVQLVGASVKDPVCHMIQPTLN